MNLGGRKEGFCVNRVRRACPGLSNARLRDEDPFGGLRAGPSLALNASQCRSENSETGVVSSSNSEKQKPQQWPFELT